MALVQYSASNFKTVLPYKEEIWVDEDFVSYLDKMNEAAQKRMITIGVTSAFRLNSDHINGAVVTPAKKSNHFVGHAIDLNLICNGMVFKSDDLSIAYQTKVPTIIQQIIKNFIAECKTDGMRYGGDFKPTETANDPVHMDSGLYQRDPEKWKELYTAYHSSI